MISVADQEFSKNETQNIAIQTPKALTGRLLSIRGQLRSDPRSSDDGYNQEAATLVALRPACFGLDDGLVGKISKAIYCKRNAVKAKNI